MRFVMFMIPDVYQGAEGKNIAPDFAPPTDMVEQMMKYNERLAKAGALLALDGLHPLQKGARVSFATGKPSVTDGPFIESKEVFGGYWIIQCKNKEEAVQWAKDVPAQRGDVIEVRQIFENEDFPADVQKAAENEVVKAAVEKHTHR
ncbi:MAG: transcription initiation protein [Ignavibacteria bacterium GWA2_55_11]|nr:MAG: transcription initiation protein [Ignavibacteria bacterium GWA2_55_11]OGU71146.1 MAG: transcription initiation protein [Ignavibacteria bacterium RIFCSPLOWO2_12_FULL_56_21]OGU72008.1 MAG: transcription initiation protein [Ignavibacteria bacterium RIFCSPLOWO2_02_FULL_55_14]